MLCQGKTTTHALGPSSKRRPIFTTTGWPSVHHYTMPTGQFVLANGLAGAEQRVAYESHLPFATRPSARLVTLFPQSTTTTPTVRVGRLLEAKPSKFLVPADGCATADQRAAHNARKLSATGPLARPGTLLPQSTTTTTTALGGRPVQALLRIAVALVLISLALGLQATHGAHELFAPGPSAKHNIPSQA